MNFLKNVLVCFEKQIEREFSSIGSLFRYLHQLWLEQAEAGSQEENPQSKALSPHLLSSRCVLTESWTWECSRIQTQALQDMGITTSVFQIYPYLFEWRSDRALCSSGSLPKCQQQLHLGQNKPKVWKFFLISHNPSSLAYICCLSCTLARSRNRSGGSIPGPARWSSSPLHYSVCSEQLS